MTGWMNYPSVWMDDGTDGRIHSFNISTSLNIYN
jgi:hypothetical protein